MIIHKCKLNVSFLILYAFFLLLNLTCCNSSSALSSNNNSFNGSFDSRKKVFLKDDFSGVCYGSKIDAASPFDKTPNIVSPIVIFYEPDENKGYKDDTYGIPKDWTADYPDISKNQLVGCVKVASRKEKKKCTFNEKGQKYILTMNDAKFNLKVYEALTGSLVAEKDFELKADNEYPMIEFFSGTDKSEDPDYKPAMINFLKPFIKH